jgi:FlaG/FlaF family flagellin (archaellin)
MSPDNKMKKTKRGMSAVVATVLIVMLTVAAVAILAGVLVPFVRNSLGKSTECLPYRGYYIFEESFGTNCYKTGADNTLYAVSIKTGSAKELANNTEGFRIVFNMKSGETKPVEITNGLPSSRQSGGVWIIGDAQANLRTPGSGGIITYGYNDASKVPFESVAVYPVLKSGRICGDERDEITLKPCGEEIIIS